MLFRPITRDGHPAGPHGRDHEPATKPAAPIAAFREAARKLGCDESEARFQDALRKIAKQKPKEIESGRRRRETRD